MTRVIAIGGEPGAGKSTLMKKLIDHYKPEAKYTDIKLVPYLQSGKIYILGKYEEGEVFSGTDRMSMAVQPEAVKFLDNLPSDSIVLYEGDRLFNSSFLENCVDKFDTKIIYLSTDKDVRTERYKERGSDQNPTWLQGRETKINNIMSNMTLLFHIIKYTNNTILEQNVIVRDITKMIEE